MLKISTRKKLFKVIKYPARKTVKQYLYMGVVTAVKRGKYLWSESFGAWRISRDNALKDAQSMIERQDFTPRFY